MSSPLPVGNNDTEEVFASLTAANSQTSYAMRNMINALYTQEDMTHHRLFLRRHAGPLAARRSISFLPKQSNSSSSQESVDDEEVVSLQTTPCFIFSLSETACPFEPDTGWWLGVGDINEYPINAGVDIMIPSSHFDVSRPYGNNIAVHVRQGYFAFDPGATTFWLHARHRGIEINGEPIRPGNKKMMTPGSRISIGPYRYIFEFNVANDQAFQSQKRAWLSRYCGADNQPSSTSGTPSANDIQIRDWHLHRVLGASPISIVRSASNVNSGEVVAMKTLLLDPSSANSSTEIELYSTIRDSIRDHPYRLFVMQMHSVLTNEHPLSSGMHEVHLLWKPLARGHFGEFGPQGRWSQESHAIKKILFVQVLFGVLALHECGWIHRDIKPENLGVVELGEKPHAIILDQGQATRMPCEGLCDTIGYLAPEVENRKFADFYNAKTDVWSLGAVGYFLFKDNTLWSTTNNIFAPEYYDSPGVIPFRNACLALQNESRDTLWYLIGRMLAVRPGDRPDIAQVLEHPAIRTECEMVLRDLDSRGRSM